MQTKNCFAQNSGAVDCQMKDTTILKQPAGSNPAQERKGVMDYEVSGWTYPAKEILADAGFVYIPKRKVWIGDEDALSELKRVTTPAYGRARQKLMDGLKIKQI